MEDFVPCFRKQFTFQKGKGGMRRNMYYPGKSNYQRTGLKTDTWIMMVFINVARQYSFSDEAIRSELHIRQSLYEEIKNELPNILSPHYHDKKLQALIHKKSCLVINSIIYTHNKKPFTL